MYRCRFQKFSISIVGKGTEFTILKENEISEYILELEEENKLMGPPIRPSEDSLDHQDPEMTMDMS